MLKVSDEPDNKMTAENVAMVIAPNLFLATSVGNKSQAMEHELMIAAATSKITLLLLTNYSTLWMVRISSGNLIITIIFIVISIIIIIIKL